MAEQEVLREEKQDIDTEVAKLEKQLAALRAKQASKIAGGNASDLGYVPPAASINSRQIRIPSQTMEGRMQNVSVIKEAPKVADSNGSNISDIPPAAIILSGQIRTLGLGPTAEQLMRNVKEAFPQGANIFMFVSADEFYQKWARKRSGCEGKFKGQTLARAKESKYSGEGIVFCAGQRTSDIEGLLAALRPTEVHWYNQTTHDLYLASMGKMCDNRPYRTERYSTQFWGIERGYALVLDYERKHRMQHSFYVRVRPDLFHSNHKALALNRISRAPWATDPAVWVAPMDLASGIDRFFVANAAAARLGALSIFNTTFSHCDKAWPTCPGGAKLGPSTTLPHCALDLYWRRGGIKQVFDVCIFTGVAPHGANTSDIDKQLEKGYCHGALSCSKLDCARKPQPDSKGYCPDCPSYTKQTKGPKHGGRRHLAYA